MRTWTLSDRGGVVQIKPHLEPSFTGESLISVIELEPVLDLLERWQKWLGREPWSEGERFHDIERDTIALLRTHGRLDG